MTGELRLTAQDRQLLREIDDVFREAAPVPMVSAAMYCAVRESRDAAVSQLFQMRVNRKRMWRRYCRLRKRLVKAQVAALVAAMVAVVTFTSNFRWILMPFVPVVKVDHFVIGLLYLLRNGIVMFDTVQVLPRIPLLRRLLPMETCLKAQFKIPCKIITEVENITKIALKALDRNRIQAMMGI